MVVDFLPLAAVEKSLVRHRRLRISASVKLVSQSIPLMTRQCLRVTVAQRHGTEWRW